MKKLHIRNTALVLGFLAAISCIDDAEFVEVDDLGTPVKEISLEDKAGSVAVKVYTNKQTSANFIGDCDWAEIKTSSINADGEFVVEYLANSSYPRHAKIEFVTPTRRDTCVLLQNGKLKEEFNINKYVITSYDAQPEEVVVSIESRNQEYSHSVRYISGYGWMKVTRNAGKLTIEPSVNEDGGTREAEIQVSWADGWGRLQQKTIVFRQAAAGQTLVEKTFAEVRAAVGSESAWNVAEDVAIVGYVINEKNENAGECHMEVMDKIDYDSNNTTVYFEDESAEYGFRLVCASSQANTFTQYTKVKLLLNGCSVVKSENPEKYDITEVSSDMILSAEYVGKEGMPKKVKAIRELTPADIYTYVTLKECELPVRKGSLTPVNEGYTRAFDANKIAKYPTLVRDAEGSSLYMYTNMTCSYRRDGSKLPYGSGNISGVIVNEEFQPFGDMGTYQIRHLSREDIALSQTMEENSFSGLLSEYRFIKKEDMTTENETGAITPTHGTNGYLTQTGSTFYGIDKNRQNPFDAEKTYKIKGLPTSDFSYLGPCVKSEAGKTTNGFGVVLENGTDYGVEFPLISSETVNAEGKGSSFNTMAWASAQFGKHASGMYNGWVVCFSTVDINTSVLSAQVSMLNTYSGSPTKLRVQYLVPSDPSAELDDLWGLVWTDVMEFTIPNVVAWTNTQLTQCPGFKPVNIQLPADQLCGKEKVYIRLVPNSSSKSGASAMNYFAVRYNK